MSDLNTAEIVLINISEVFISLGLVIYGFKFLLRHITPEKFYVEACDDGADDVLIIDRVSTEVTLSGILQPDSEVPEQDFIPKLQ